MLVLVIAVVVVAAVVALAVVVPCLYSGGRSSLHTQVEVGLKKFDWRLSFSAVDEECWRGRKMDERLE